MRTKAPLLGVVLLLGACTASVDADAVQPARSGGAGTLSATTYTTGDSSELITTLPVTSKGPHDMRVMFCLDLETAPRRGEILVVTADTEVTNDLGYEVGFTTHVVLADSCESLSGTEICEAQGTNITPDNHHGTATRSGMITISSRTSRRYLVMIVWALSTAAEPGDALQVNLDYGRLSALRLTPV